MPLHNNFILITYKNKEMADRDFVKIPQLGVRELAQQLHLHSTLAIDLSSVPNTDFQRHTSPCNSTSKGIRGLCPSTITCTSM